MTTSFYIRFIRTRVFSSDACVFYSSASPAIAPGKPTKAPHKTLIHFEFTDVDENTVIDVLRQLPLKSSFGFDGISSHLLHNIELYLVKPLTLLAKQTLNSGIFPDKLKIAKVIPIFKKGDSTQFTNYRPISLLPVISKVLQKIIYKQLYCFFKEHDLLYESQYGFRTEHSTELAAMELIDRLILTMDNNETPLNIYIWTCRKHLTPLIILFLSIS